jgi:hypothetical protein
MPRWASGVAVLAGVYVAVMLAAALWMPKEWDWTAFQWLSSRVPPEFSDDVSIVDVAWDPSDIPSNRRRVAAFLDGLVASKQRPSAVILDIEFDPCQSKPCGEPMESARKALIASIRSATSLFSVYATEEPHINGSDAVTGPLDPLDSQIYGAVTGAAHTDFIRIPESDGFYYSVCYPDVPFADESGDVEGTENVWDMVDRVRMSARTFASSPPCEPNDVTLRLGPKLALAPPNVYSFSDPRTFSSYARFDSNTYVILGTLKYDRQYPDRSGPELLGWALSNALEGSVRRDQSYDTKPQNGMLLLVVPAFSGLAVVAFVALYYQLKRTRLRSWRRALPWLSSGLAALFGLAVFAAFEIWNLASHNIQPQVSLISLGIVVASGLSGFRGFQMLADEENAIDVAPTETYDYDVFISYAHDEGAWVFEHVYAPFRDATLANGKKLSVFFDTSSIRTGTAWQSKLALAIDGSRFVVPVYSDVYFTKPYCRFEIMRAHRKWVLAGEDSRSVLPIMRGHPKILPAVDDIQALSIDDHPDIVKQNVAEIVARLSRDAEGKARAQPGSAQQVPAEASPQQAPAEASAQQVPTQTDGAP